VRKVAENSVLNILYVNEISLIETYPGDAGKADDV
jgi:hypothetical protein